MTYKHFFFDLDQTLWDFEKNSKITLEEIYSKFNLKLRGVESFEEFFSCYTQHNNELWSYFRAGKIDKDYLRKQRFKLVLNEFQIYDDQIEDNISNTYFTLCPQKTNLFPYTIETLGYLKDKYLLHVITNGFEEQYIKLDRSGLREYFHVIVTSEKAQCSKPNPAIFKYALEQSNAEPYESVMVGDNISVDLLGARTFGMDQIFFNPNFIHYNEKFTYEIHCLRELQDLF